MHPTSVKNPIVFISYSWTNEQHENWVYDLATRLSEDGVLVKFDKWDLKTGHDKFTFMESMVNDASVNKVLIICDKGYQEKGNNRQGGVGTETQILTPQIYSNASQEKFIPIVAERDEEGNVLMPTFISSRMYRDLSNPEIYEKEYEKLLHDIFEKPKYQRPALGQKPAFLEEEATTSFSPINRVMRKINLAVENAPKRLARLSEEYKDAFFLVLENFKINESEINGDIHIDDVILFKIQEMKPLRDSFIEFVKKIDEGIELDSDFFINFFEDIVAYTEKKESGSYNRFQFDHYKFLINELFLHLTSLIIKSKNYDVLSELLEADYNFDLINLKGRDMRFDYLNLYSQSLIHRNERLKMHRISLQADILLDRCHEKEKENLVDADIILHNISAIAYPELINWYPKTAVYENFSSRRIKFFSKLKSTSYFEQIKFLFQVNNKEEFKEKVIQQKSARIEFHSIPIIRFSIDPEDICSKA